MEKTAREVKMTGDGHFLKKDGANRVGVGTKTMLWINKVWSMIV